MDGVGAARSMVFGSGDRVRTSGRLVRRGDGDWLDVAQSGTLVHHPPAWKSRVAVRLINVEAVAGFGLPDLDGAVVPGRVAVVGRWHQHDGEDAGVIVVDSQSAVRRERRPPPLLLALPAPAGGWDTASDSTELEGLDKLRTSDAIVRDEWLQDASGALLLRVAAADVDAVTSVLGPQLPRRLCVVRSRYTARQLREVQDACDSHSQAWGLERWSTVNLDPQCQPRAVAVLMRVSAELAEWADCLPEGLLTLSPTIRPAGDATGTGPGS